MKHQGVNATSSEILKLARGVLQITIFYSTKETVPREAKPKRSVPQYCIEGRKGKINDLWSYNNKGYGSHSHLLPPPPFGLLSVCYSFSCLATEEPNNPRDQSWKVEAPVCVFVYHFECPMVLLSPFSCHCKLVRVLETYRRKNL